MPVRSKKNPLPKTMSYVLKSSLLERALAEAAIELDVYVVHGAGNSFIRAYFWPSNPNVQHERLYIQAGAVPREASHEARRFVEEAVLPALVAWLNGILALPANSTTRREKQYFFRRMPMPATVRSSE